MKRLVIVIKSSIIQSAYQSFHHQHHHHENDTSLRADGESFPTLNSRHLLFKPSLPNALCNGFIEMNVLFGKKWRLTFYTFRISIQWWLQLNDIPTWGLSTRCKKLVRQKYLRYLLHHMYLATSAHPNRRIDAAAYTSIPLGLMCWISLKNGTW